jgi:predicted dinucleotide-binding enzyme
MKIGVFGTGRVGQTIGSKLVSVGQDVMMGSRSANNEAATAWAAGLGARASHGTYAAAAAFGEVIFNCTRGDATLDVLRAAGADRLRDKILIDVSNPLDFSKGMPPRLFVFNDDSLAEQIQREFPETHVVKSLNTINCGVMVEPSKLSADHDLFVSGNDAEAKQTVVRLLKEWFGWKTIIDLGDISTARGTESYLALWIRMFGALKTADFNIKVVR